MLLTVHRRRAGVVLLVVLMFAMLLSASVATFTRRAVIDAMIARNRVASARAEALARGGARLAAAFLIHDRLWEQAKPFAPPGETHLDRWYRIREAASSWTWYHSSSGLMSTARSRW